MHKILSLVMVGLALGSCGSGASGTCQQIGTAICAKACACRDGAGCAISQGSQGGLSLTFNHESDCRGWFVTLGCSMGDKAAYNDAAACLPLVNAATCTGTGADGALSFPSDMACETPDDMKQSALR